MNQLLQLMNPTKREQELGVFRTWSWPFGAFPNGERNKRNAYQRYSETAFWDEIRNTGESQTK